MYNAKDIDKQKKISISYNGFEERSYFNGKFKNCTVFDIKSSYASFNNIAEINNFSKNNLS
ncbi:MAG: hypothetical protein KID00_07960 [Clostridium argentinense]|uniref:Uncharacterized protein n=1 Tax=Clostridium faecium TaxID=2762223 RepID=A0ABR8YX45_9CLOT|nr:MULTISPECIES: hypothetical protein [Clostridium]MBD8048795.1 hypothetical protein [Clostridium faecium]MBS5823785.1 hypothetical protein [Clostridium argentinense]MDU1350183.1 hypothetical protein [Clostridium argentinense]